MLSSKEEAEWFGAESFEAEYHQYVYVGNDELARVKGYKWCIENDRDVQNWIIPEDEPQFITNQFGQRVGYSVDRLSKMSFKAIDKKSGYLGDIIANLGLMDSWSKLSISKRKEILNKIKKQESWMGWEAESFEAETTIAKQYGETLDNLDDLQKIVKKTISPKRKPTKFIKDAKSSVVDSWKQMGKDGFRRQMYEPMEFEAEIPKSVKLGFGFGAGLALFQVAVIGSAIGLGMLLNKE